MTLAEGGEGKGEEKREEGRGEEKKRKEEIREENDQARGKKVKEVRNKRKCLEEGVR